MTIRPLIMLTAACLLLAAAPRLNWQTSISPTADGGHLIGNPAAKVKLTEYISYTCPHCAHFYKEGDGALTLQYVSPGKMAMEVQPYLRNNIDVTIALLSNCGPASKFPAIHRAFLLGQDGWIKNFNQASPAQQARWSTGDFAARQRAVANDGKFYDMMERFGLTRPQVDRCLANLPLAQRIAKATEAVTARGMTGTPAFAINGDLLKDTADWASLEPQVKAKVEGAK